MGRRDPGDWRDQVRDTVARHKEKKRREQEKLEDDARQLSIFPEERFEDENEKLAQKRRAEIRARVEQRIAKRPPPSARGRVLDAGDFPLGGGRAVAATARDLARQPAPREPEPDEAELEPASRADDEGDLEISLGEAGAAEIDESPGDFGLASGFERLFSGLVDLTFVALIQLTLFYLTTHLVAQRLGALPQSALVAMGLVGAVMAAGYFLFFWSLSGQTLGKLLTGSRVVDRRGGALGFGRAAFRLLAVIVAALPLGAGFIGLWSDPERRGWHDRIAGTKVVRG